RGYSTSSFGLTVSPVAAKDGEMQRDVWYSYARRRRALEDAESIGRTAAARALRRLGARKVKTAEVPVIFDPDTAASLLRSIAGAASGPSLYRRASFLLERLGSRIAAPTVTIVDDGLLPGALGSRPFDGEGLPTRRTVLVGEGTLQSYLLDTYSARKLGQRPRSRSRGWSWRATDDRRQSLPHARSRVAGRARHAARGALARRVGRCRGRVRCREQRAHPRARGRRAEGRMGLSRLSSRPG